MVNVHSVYGYGAPRIGSREYQSTYNAMLVPGSPFATLVDATFTLIHDCDVVPRLPGYLAGFRRPGRDEFLSSFSSGPNVLGEIVPDILEDPSVLSRLGSDIYSLVRAWLAKRNAIAFKLLLTDHHIDNYIAALNQTEVAA
jgi:hypothetical protein